MAVVGGGGQAELAVVHERTALRVPPDLPWPEAGGFPEVFTTARPRCSQCGLAIGEHLLVHGAAGGVGIAGVQLGVLAGARVTATVRNADLRDAVAAIVLGAVGPTGAPVDVMADAVWADTGPYDVVLELIGAPNLAGDVAGLAPGGRIAIIGVGGGARGAGPARPHGEAGPHPRVHAAGPPPRTEGRCGPARGPARPPGPRRRSPPDPRRRDLPDGRCSRRVRPLRRGRRARQEP